MSKVNKPIPELQIQDTAYKKLNYFLVWLSIGQCGVGFLVSKYVYVISFVLLLFIILLKHNSQSVKALPWALAISFVYVLQSFLFNALDVGYAQIGLVFLRNIIAAMYLAVVGKDYFKYFVRIMYFYTIMALGFWLICLFFPPIESALRAWSVRFSALTGTLVVDFKATSFFLLYTFTKTAPWSVLPPNAGPMWEPGAYAVYLGVAMTVVLLTTRSLKNKYQLVFILAMLTTQSSAGYPTLFALLLLAIVVGKLSITQKAPLSLFIGILGIGAYLYLPFLQGKVTSMYQAQASLTLKGGVEINRFDAARRSLNAITTYPILGRGISNRTAAEEGSDVRGAFGIVDMIARYGLILGSIFILSFIGSLRLLAARDSQNGSLLISVIAFFALFPVLFAQSTYASPVIMAIVSYGWLFRRTQFSPR